jgi:hypothetical protein
MNGDTIHLPEALSILFDCDQQFPLTRRVVDRGEFGAAARTGRRSSPSPTRDDVETVS